MPIDLYYSPFSPPCRAVLSCCRQLSIDVNLKRVSMKSGDLSTADYRKLNPNQLIPTIVDNDLVLWESRAILRYLANAYAPNTCLYPSEPKRRAIIDKWLDLSLVFHDSLRNAIIFKTYKGVEPTEQHKQTFHKNFAVMDTLIGDNHYLTGAELTIADLSLLASVVRLSDLVDHELNSYPNLRQWSERMKTSLPYYKEIFG